MSARGFRRVSAALAVLIAAGFALVGNPVERGTLDAPPPPAAVLVAPEPPPRLALSPEQLSAHIAASIVSLTARSDLGITAGTGIVLRPDSADPSSVVALTNHHVVDGGHEITAASMRDRSAYSVDVVGYDSSRDLAVLRLRGAARLSPAPLGTSDSVRIGDPVTAVGNADGGGVPVAAPGAVTRLGVRVTTRNTTDGSRNELSNLLEMDARVRPGDSGGPLLNVFGEVVGVNSAGNATPPGVEVPPDARSYAIPIDAAADLVDQVLAGRPSATVHIGPTPLLGVDVRDYREEQAATPAGAQVTAVGFRTPAERAGLSRGDVIVEFDGAPIRSATDLTTQMNGLHPGDRVDVQWIDPVGRTHTGSLVLQEGPPR